jgi:hypothetical protein
MGKFTGGEVDKKFRGIDCDFPMLVKLEGKNVIEGVKELVAQGVVKPPLPDYLGQLHTLASNKFVIHSETKTIWKEYGEGSDYNDDEEKGEKPQKEGAEENEEE